MQCTGQTCFRFGGKVGTAYSPWLSVARRLEIAFAQEREFNMELGTELKAFLAANDPEEANATADEMIANSEKILNHGKRIADIVAQLIEQTRKAEAGELEVDEHNLHDFS